MHAKGQCRITGGRGEKEKEGVKLQVGKGLYCVVLTFSLCKARLSLSVLLPQQTSDTVSLSGFCFILLFF